MLVSQTPFFFSVSLSNSEPLEYAVYKPVVVLFGLVDGLQHMLKVNQYFCVLMLLL